MTFLLNDKMGWIIKKWGDFRQFFMLNICLFLKIEHLRTFPTYNRDSLAFYKTFSLQPSTSFLRLGSEAVSKGEVGCKITSVVRVDMARNVCILLFFLLQTVNGKAGPFGTAPKAVHSFSLWSIYAYVFYSLSDKEIKYIFKVKASFHL